MVNRGEHLEVLMERLPTYRVLNATIHALTLASTTEILREAVDRQAKTYVVFCTVSSVLSARDDPGVQSALDEATLVTPDGMPLVWLGKRAGMDTERVYGPDLMLEVFERLGGSVSHYFYGGAPGIPDEMVRRMQERFPRLQVAGLCSPPRGLTTGQPDEDGVARIESAQPDFVWVGLGHPKQELWMQTNRPLLSAPVLAGVGAAFDFFAGVKKEAPRWMRSAGLQWAHRLASEPTRLWKRYLVGNSRFLALLAAESLKKRRQ